MWKTFILKLPQRPSFYQQPKRVNRKTKVSIKTKIAIGLTYGNFSCLVWNIKQGLTTKFSTLTEVLEKDKIKKELLMFYKKNL